METGDEIWKQTKDDYDEFIKGIVAYSINQSYSKYEHSHPFISQLYMFSTNHFSAFFCSPHSSQSLSLLIQSIVEIYLDDTQHKIKSQS